MIFTPKQYAWHALGVMLLSGLLCVVVQLIGFTTDFLDPIGQALGRFSFIDTYFYIENNSGEESMEYNPDIVLLDLAGCDSRAKIAQKLQEVHNLHPRAIGMDAIFGQSVTTNQADDDSLTRVVARCTELTSAKRMTQAENGYSEEHSYYVQKTHCDEACINMEDDVVRNFSDSLHFGQATEQSFVSHIMQKAYPDIYRKWHNRNHSEERINYRGLAFDEFAFSDTLTAADIKGKVVLIGDLQDPRDYHDVPMTMGGSQRIAGTRIHAYAMSTPTMGRDINQTSDTAGWIYGTLISYLFALLCCIIFVEFDKLSGFATNALQVALLLLLSMIGGFVFIRYQYELNMLVAMLGIGIVGFTTEVWFWLSTTRPYLWLQKRLHLPDGGVRHYVDTTNHEQ
jgi:CHASE2 domain-containing sensor protein